MTIQNFTIVRRAFGKTEVFAHFTGTWVEGTCKAMELEAHHRDGEYSIRRMDEPLINIDGQAFQSGFDYL